MSIFSFEDYRPFLLSRLHSFPNEGKGEYRKLAKLLQVSSSFLSQVVKGKKSFSHDHAFGISKYFGLSDLETRYFIGLINLEKASKSDLKSFIKMELKKLREEALNHSGLSNIDQPLDENSQGIFYSSWQQSAIQLATGIKGLQTPEAIGNRLGIEVNQVIKILNFLVDTGLCVFDGDQFKVGVRRTHLNQDSPLRGRHHLNWRLKASDHLPKSKDDFFFTFPMRIDEVIFSKIKKQIQILLEDANESVSNAKDEILACLNIDFFKF